MNKKRVCSLLEFLGATKTIARNTTYTFQDEQTILNYLGIYITVTTKHVYIIRGYERIKRYPMHRMNPERLDRIVQRCNDAGSEYYDNQSTA